MKNKRNYKATISNSINSSSLNDLLRARGELATVSAEEAEKERAGKRTKKDTAKEAASAVRYRLEAEKLVVGGTTREQSAWAEAQAVLSERAEKGAERRACKTKSKAKTKSQPPRFDIQAATYVVVADQAKVGGRRLLAKAVASGSIEDLEAAVRAVKGLGLGEETTAKKVLSALKDAEWLASLS